MCDDTKANRPIKKRRGTAGSFKPGNAGGPGRPRGSRNKSTIVLEKMMADDGADVVRAVIERANVNGGAGLPVPAPMPPAHRRNLCRGDSALAAHRPGPCDRLPHSPR